ncbi:NUDIX hydrolase [Irregularibacter muris]|uniref:NUDIX hydrolase n=1 Tax=Irregularibacter muris TaxID=1796619 RepID=A0AAE3L2H1_9FIRM|nr:NUDIX hydrolase [Irregularibacter muris]MCR1898544.1 NUDIX hydrolase [Irregularibacter muris]
MKDELKWLQYAKKLQAIAQAGLEYSKDKYDIERFEEIRDISIDIMHNYTDIEHAKIKELFASETGYQTPKIDVRAAVLKEDRILLIKEKIDGLWAMPGGWADVDCSLKENLIKEAMEEAGAEIIPQRILSLEDAKKHSSLPMPYGIYKIIVQCRLVKINFKKNIETSEVGFFSLDELPALSLGRTTKEHIKMALETNEKPFHEAIFD